MMHLAAYYKSVNSAAGLAALNAVADQAVFTNGPDIRVPGDIANLLGEAALSAQTAPLFAQVQSPSLRQLANQDIKPVTTALVFSQKEQLQWHGDNPRGLAANEAIDFYLQATGGAAAGNYGLVWLGDGPIKPTNGKTFSVRATGAAALSAGVWVNTPLTFDVALPAGTFQVVGIRAEGTNLIAARAVFIGSAYRPGVPGETSAAAAFWTAFRNGRMGVYGQFDINQPPTMDCLGATDTTQEFVFDLIQVK